METNKFLKNEDKLLLLASTRLDNKIEEIRELTALDLDWDYLTQSAYKHRLNPIFYWNLNNISPDAMPNMFKLQLKEDFHKNAKKNLGMFSELLAVVDELNQHKIDYVIYKGPLLSIMAYDNIGLRVFSDLDFFIPIKHVTKVRDILIKNGYVLSMELSSRQEVMYHKYQREYHLYNQSKRINLELKWKLFSEIFPIDDRPFFHEKGFVEEISINNFKIKTISKDFQILILSIHNATHLFSSLNRFCDIFEIIKTEDKIYWDHLFNIANKHGVKRIFMINLYVLMILFEINFPKNVSNLLNSDKKVEQISEIVIRRMFSNNRMGIGEEIVFYLKLHENIVDKIKILINLVFLPTAEVIGSVSLPKIFEPIYFFLRVVQMFKNLKKQ